LLNKEVVYIHRTDFKISYFRKGPT